MEKKILKLLTQGEHTKFKNEVAFSKTQYPLKSKKVTPRK